LIPQRLSNFKPVDFIPCHEKYLWKKGIEKAFKITLWIYFFGISGLTAI
jgi:hypothetical protein